MLLPCLRCPGLAASRISAAQAVICNTHTQSWSLEVQVCQHELALQCQNCCHHTLARMAAWCSLLRVPNLLHALCHVWAGREQASLCVALRCRALCSW